MEGKAWIIILGKTQHSHVGHENPIHMIRIRVLRVEVEGEERNHEEIPTTLVSISEMKVKAALRNFFSSFQKHFCMSNSELFKHFSHKI